MERGPESGSVVAGGVELFWRRRGAGTPLLLLHETAATAEIWRSLTEALDGQMRSIAVDRRGWGGSGAPEPYLRTTIEEQAEDAATVLAQLADREAVGCGSGLGAVVVLDLLVRRPNLLRAAILIEPPLLAFLPEATEGLSGDRRRIEEALREGGPGAAVELYLAGALPFLGPGAERIPATASEQARARPLSLFAELAAVADWPIRPAALRAVSAPSLIVAADGPPLLAESARRLAAELGASRLLLLGGPGPPHVEAAPELARALRDLLRSPAAPDRGGR